MGNFVTVVTAMATPTSQMQHRNVNHNVMLDARLTIPTVLNVRRIRKGHVRPSNLNVVVIVLLILMMIPKVNVIMVHVVRQLVSEHVNVPVTAVVSPDPTHGVTTTVLMILDLVVGLVTLVMEASVSTKNVPVSVVSLMPSVMISVVTMTGIVLHSVWMIVRRTLMTVLCVIVLKIVLIGAIILVLMIVKLGAGLSRTGTGKGHHVSYDAMATTPLMISPVVRKTSKGAAISTIVVTGTVVTATSSLAGTAGILITMVTGMTASTPIVVKEPVALKG